MQKPRAGLPAGSNREYAAGLGRAAVGSVLFALPLFMTMEMWAFGFTLEAHRLIAMLVAFLPILVGLSYFAGFESAFGIIDHVLDAFAALAVASICAVAVLALLGVLNGHEPIEHFAGKIAVVSLPGAMGALLADKQLGDGERSADAEARSYFARLFLMGTGALFVALNVAPTEEMVLIAYQISQLQALLLALVSLLALHALLFWADLPGREGRRRDEKFFSVLFRYSFAGYGLCALISAALLWAFGRLENASLLDGVEYVVVLSFPAALGAGIAQALIGEKRGEAS